jgi:hypothetical protein
MGTFATTNSFARTLDSPPCMFFLPIMYFMSHTLGKYSLSCSLNCASDAGSLSPVISLRRYLHNARPASDKVNRTELGSAVVRALHATD